MTNYNPKTRPFRLHLAQDSKHTYALITIINEPLIPNPSNDSFAGLMIYGREHHTKQTQLLLCLFAPVIAKSSMAGKNEFSISPCSI